MAVAPISGTSIPKESVTPHDFGFVEGVSTPAETVTALEAAIATGQNVRLPGEYTLDRQINISGASDQVIFGDKWRTKLTATHDDYIFRVDNAGRITFRDMSFVGSGLPITGTNHGAINALNSSLIEIDSCYFTQFTGYIVNFQGVDGFQIHDNLFFDNPATTVEDGGADIYVTSIIQGSNPGSAITPSSAGVISGNLCLSNNRIGISATFSNSHGISVLNNVCMSLKPDLSEPTPSEMHRKEGIIASYNCETQMAGQPWDVTISGNIVRNTAYIGIYANCQDAADVDSGPSLTISGNTVSNVSQQILSGSVGNRQGGIAITAARRYSVTGNLVYDVDHNELTQSAEPAGIRIYGLLPGAYHDAVGVCSSNVVENVGGPCVHLTALEGHHVVSNNVIRDGKKLLVQTGLAGPNASLTITGNDFLRENRSDAGWQDTMVDCFHTTTHDGEIIFSNNRVVTKFLSSSASFTRFFSSRVTMVGNRFIGSSSTNGEGIRLQFDGAYAPRRLTDIQVANNHYENMFYGLYVSDTFGGRDFGPVVEQGSTYRNVANPRPNPAGYAFAGSINADALEVWSNGPPTIGNWLRGDRVRNNTPAVGQPIEWVCTAGGNSTSMTWVAGPTL